MTQRLETNQPLPASSTTQETSRICALREPAGKSPLNGDLRSRAKRRNKKPRHDMAKCKQTTRTVWHEAGHALIALMNHPESICSLEYFGGDVLDGCLGVCRLEDLTPFGHTADYMPPELDLAGVVAECILTGEDFYDVWWSYSAHGQTDISNFEVKCQRWGIDIDIQMDTMVEHTFFLLTSHRGVLRQIAKKLKRCKCLFSYRGSWLNEVGRTLTPMPNPRLHEALECRHQWMQQFLADKEVLDAYYERRLNANGACSQT